MEVSICESGPGGVTALFREDTVGSETFRALDEAITGMLWVGTAEGSCEYLGRRWPEYVRTNLQHAIGNPVLHFIHPEDEAAAREALREATKTGQPHEAELRLRRFDGAYRWHCVRCAPERGHENEIKRWIVVCTDIEDQKSTERELHGFNRTLQRAREDTDRARAESKVQLQEAVEQLETFAYSIAHDMRAPLRTLHQYAEMVAKDFAHEVPLEARVYLNKIMGASERLDSLIREVLIYTRVSQGRMDLKSMNLDRLLTNILTAEPALLQPDVELNVRAPLMPVIGDQTAMTQAFTHLLANAVKFVPAERKPRVTIWTEQIGDKVRLFFRDNGIGVAASDRERIFKMFERLQPEARHAGSGIGLTIVRRAVERMGGTLGVESAEGQGSVFWIELKKGEPC
jgi:PAS domain S-box-containing protein